MKLGLLFLLCATACDASRVVPSPVDASADASQAPVVDASTDAAIPSRQDASPTLCESACDALLAAGCPEGSNPGCVGTCDHLVATPLVAFDAACLAKAKSSAQVRRCGVACASTPRACHPLGPQ